MRAYELQENDQSDIEEVKVPGGKYRIQIPKTMEKYDELSLKLGWKQNYSYNPIITSKSSPVYFITYLPTGDKWLWRIGDIYIKYDGDRTFDSIVIRGFLGKHKAAAFAIIRHFGGLESVMKVDPINWLLALDDPSLELQKLAILVTGQGSVLKAIKNPSDEIKWFAIEHTSDAIEYIENPGKELLEFSVRVNPLTIKYIPYPPVELQLIAVNARPSNLQHIKPKQSPEAQLRALELDPIRAPKWVKNPRTEVRQYMADNKLFKSKRMTKKAQWIRDKEMKNQGIHKRFS